MIIDPAGEKYALADDGRLLTRVIATPLDEHGKPTGERFQIGYCDVSFLRGGIHP